MSKHSGKIGLYLLLIVALIAGYLYLNDQVSTQGSYTMGQLEKALEEDKVTDAVIHQNREVPTGYVTANIVSDGQKTVYVTDVKEAEALLEEHDIDPTIRNVPKDSSMIGTVLPVVLTGAILLFFFMMMNRQMSGGGGSNAKMMNFGKSRAKMSRTNSVDFSKVAGLEEEKEDLFERIEQGDLLAREHYIKGNLRLVLSIIQRFSGSNENADDLFQVGCIGLMKAIDNFDRNLNVKFSTYAVPMIIGEVKRYLRDNHSMRVSRSLRDTAYKAINAREVLTKKLNHEPTIDVIAKEIDMKKEDVLFALDAIATPLSLYEPVYQDGGDTLYLMDQVKDKKNKEDSWVESIALKEAMEHLPDREYDIIKMRFFEGKTQTEVADEIAISQAQVSRLEKNALKHMKNHLV